MIQKAKVSDLEEMGSLCRQFLTASKFAGYDPGHFVASWSHVLNMGIGAIFLMKKGGQITGMLGCLKAPDLSTGIWIATELFWFVDPEYRGPESLRLMIAFEEWAKEENCGKVMMSALEDSMPEKLDRIYKRHGYEVLETNYVKEI